MGGGALQVLDAYPSGKGTAALGLVNGTFSYDPLTQGAIISITASVKKDLTTSYTNGPSFHTFNTFRPLVEQDGNYYFATISGPTLTSGTTTGYNIISGSGLIATDFVEYDFATGTFGTGNPNFDGGPMLFGLGTVSTLSTNLTPAGSTIESDFENLNIDITTAPEPSSLLLLGSGLLAVIGAGKARFSRPT